MEQTIKYTAYVIVFTAISAGLVGLLDLAFNSGYKQIVDYTVEQGITNSSTVTPTIEGGATQPIEVNVGGGTGEAKVTPAQ